MQLYNGILLSINQSISKLLTTTNDDNDYDVDEYVYDNEVLLYV